VNNLLLIVFSMLLLSGCPYISVDESECLEPVYLSYDDLRNNYPRIQHAQEIQKAAKMTVYGDTLFINEKNKGIHVIDNQDKSNPQNLYFIEIPGNIDIAIKNGFMYVDSFVDLVVLDVSDINNMTTVFREKGVFDWDGRQVVNGDFDSYGCGVPDPERGLVIGYE